MKVKILEPVPQWDWWFETKHVPVQDYEYTEILQRVRAGDMLGYSTAFLSFQSAYFRGNKPATRYERQRFLDITGRFSSDVAKAHLRGAYDLWRPRWGRGEYQNMVREGYPPIYAQPGRYEGMVYVDLRSAYYVLYTLYWGVEYWPEKWIGGTLRLIRWDDELTDSKGARNALYGYLRRAHGVVYTPSGPRFIPMSWSTYPQVALAVVDVLHVIARRMVRDFGAVYVMTDGYIIPERYADYALDYIASMGLEGRVKASGGVLVEGVGAYAWDSGLATRRRGMGKAFSNLKGEGLVQWLEPRHRWRVSLRASILGTMEA